MKKILCATLVILSFTGSAFADSGITGEPGMALRGGADATVAAAAPSPLIKYSTGVFGLINWVADAATKTSNGYVIATRHLNGSKYFATANDITNIYWKQAPKVATGTECKTLMSTDVTTGTVSATVFAAGLGWTSY